MMKLILSGRKMPLTLVGSVLVLGSLLFLVAGLNREDPLQAAAGFSGILLVAGWVLAVFINGIRYHSYSLSWNSNSFLFSGRRNETHKVSIRGSRWLPFFRIHLCVCGTLAREQHPKYLVYKEFSFSEPGEFPLKWEIPVSGTLELAGRFYFRDIFGIASFPLEGILLRQIIVLPAGGYPEQVRLLPVKKETEDNPSHKSREQEKILMREYIPGDLHRDINWKAFSRLGELFTRVPPESAGKSRRIDLILRSFASEHSDNYQSGAVLESLKRMVAGFCLQVFREYPETRIYLFVRPGVEGEYESTRSDELLTLISGLDFIHPPAESDLYYPEGETIVFSSELDGELRLYLGRLHPQKTSLSLIRYNRKTGTPVNFGLGFPSFIPLFLPGVFFGKRRTFVSLPLESLHVTEIRGVFE